MFRSVLTRCKLKPVYYDNTLNLIYFNKKIFTT